MRRRWFRWLLAGLAALGILAAVRLTSRAAATATPAPRPACQVGSWQPGAPYPIPIGGAAVVALGDTLYSFGGFTAGGVVAAAYRLDPGATTWTLLAPLPSLDFEVAAATDGTYVYLVLAGDPNNPDHLYRYDPATDQYTRLRDAPSNSDFPELADLAGQVYRLGQSVNFSVERVDRYDPASDTWAPPGTVPNYPITGANPLLLSYRGALYAAGGGLSTHTYRYDSTSNRWDDAAMADLPAPHLTAAQGLVNGRWVIAGGFAGTPRTADVIGLDLAQPSTPWVPLASLPQPRSFLPSTGTGAALYVIGGVTDDPQKPFLTDTEIYTEAACPTVTPCAGFTDVHPSDYFYPAVTYLAQRNVLSGYSDCSFRPYNNTTRAQMVKIVVLGFARPVVTPAGGTATFADVPPAFPFFSVIETAAATQIISGYTCGGPNEPCDSANRPYFRPYADVTRGQLSKIDVVAAGWAALSPPGPGTFTDVAPNTAFYPFVETAACHGVISGYACGGPGEPCDRTNRPYFRPYNAATRGQIAKIVDLSITGSSPCDTTATPTVVASATAPSSPTPTPPPPTAPPPAPSATATPTATASPIATATIPPSATLTGTITPTNTLPPSLTATPTPPGPPSPSATGTPPAATATSTPCPSVALVITKAEQSPNGSHLLALVANVTVGGVPATNGVSVFYVIAGGGGSGALVYSGTPGVYWIAGCPVAQSSNLVGLTVVVTAANVCNSASAAATILSNTNPSCP